MNDIHPADVYAKVAHLTWVIYGLAAMMILKLYWDWRTRQEVVKAQKESREAAQQTMIAITESRKDRERQREISEAVLAISEAAQLFTQNAAEKVEASADSIHTTGHEIKESVPHIAEAAAIEAIRKVADGQTTNGRSEVH